MKCSLLSAALIAIAAGSLQANPVQNASFESPVQPTGVFDWFQYIAHAGNGDPVVTVESWTFGGFGGVVVDSSIGTDQGFAGKPANAVDGIQYAMIEEYQNSASFLLQTLSFESAGTYTLSFYEAGRAVWGNTVTYDIQIIQDGQTYTLGTSTTVMDAAWHVRSYTFDIAAGEATLKFQCHAADGDGNVFFDAITLTAIPEPATLSFAAFGTASLFLSRRRS